RTPAPTKKYYEQYEPCHPSSTTDPKKSSGRSPWTKTPRTPRAPKPNAPNNAGNTSVADRPPPRRTPDRSTPSRKNSGRTAKADPARTHPSPERPENRGSPAPENKEGQSPGHTFPPPGSGSGRQQPRLLRNRSRHLDPHMSVAPSHAH